jgi:hypothetical protein
MSNRNQNNTNNTNDKNKISNANPNKLKPPKTLANSDNKRNHSSSSNSEPSSPKLLQRVSKKLFVTRNRFDVLKPTKLTERTSETFAQEKQSIADPVLTYSKLRPPVFIRGVEDFPGVCTKLIELIGVDNFICKSTADHLKIQTSNPRAYRTLVHYLRNAQAEFHTFQLNEDKPMRIVIRNLHPSTPTEMIKSELELRLYEVRQVTQVIHRISKIPLPLLFVDLEPTDHSNEIFKFESLLHTKIKIKEPQKPKIISQCHNFQAYGHTKAYCGYSPRCVRCGDDHSSSACSNSRQDPTRCALCTGNHPANYRGCTVYKNLQQHKKTNLNNHKLYVNSSLKSNNVQDSHPRNTTPNNPPTSQSQTYAQATQGQHAQSDIPLPAPDINSLMASFVSDLKTYQSINLITYSGNLKFIGKKMNNSVTNKSLVVLQFNANGLKNHKNILQNVLYDKRIDIALITETQFTKYTHFFIPRYQLIKANHPDNTAHGSVAIFIKNSIHFQPQTNYCFDHIQSFTIIVRLNNIPITVGAFYSPPRHNILNATFTNYFNTIKNNFIMGGDFNAKHSAWGCRTNNPRGNVLYNFVNTNNFNIVAPPGPTYWPSSPAKKLDIFDIFVTKIPSYLHWLTKNILDLIIHLLYSICLPLFLHELNPLDFFLLLLTVLNFKISLINESI